MRRFVTFAITVGLVSVASTGCVGGYGRPYHTDPFGAPRQARVTGAEVVTNAPRSDPRAAVTPPGSDVMQAGFEQSQPARPTTLNHAAPARRDWNRPDGHDDSNLLDDSNDLISFADSPRNPTGSATQTAAILDHAPDYSWIQGTLEYSAFGGGAWRVRYAPFSADDEHGGSVTLDATPDVERFAPGDTVFVEGQLIQNGATRSTPSPLYRVRRINRVTANEQGR